MAKLPAIQLYPGDWLRDAVSGCSLAAQALWLRMMFVAHDSERYGYLSQNGDAIPSDLIARRCGCTLDEYTSLLDELDRAGVPSRTPEGVIFSRRMVRDAKGRADAAQRKKKSRSCHGDVTPMSHASSSSSSTSPSVRQTDEGRPPPFPAFDLFDRLCKRKLTTSEQGRIHTWLDSLGDHDAGLVCACVQHAVENIASTPQTVRGAINYVAAIYERCLREGCGPGDFPAEERKPSGRESELESKRKLARKLAGEAFANESA